MVTLTDDHLNDIVTSYEGHPGPLPPVEIPTSFTIHAAYGTTNEFPIYSWDERVKKSRCFDFGDFLTPMTLRTIWVLTSKLSLVFGVASV